MEKVSVVSLSIVILIFMIGFVSASNGWWNDETKECWVAKWVPLGTPVNLSAIPGFDPNETFFSCCFGGGDYQIDCHNPSIVLGGPYDITGNPEYLCNEYSCNATDCTCINKNAPLVPEFNTITITLAILGAFGVFFLVRKIR